MRKPLLKKFTWIATFLILLVTILPNIFHKYWLVDIFANFKLQYLVISVFLLFIAGLLLKKKILALSLILLSILWNGYFVAPYYFNSKVLDSESTKKFKISSINLLSSNTEIALVKDYILKENPDVLVLMEFTPRWESDLLSITDNYPYKKLVTRTDNFGIALLSRFEMKTAIDYFGLYDKPSVIGDLKIKGARYTIVATHPVPPISQTTFINRNKQLTNIIKKKPLFSENLIIVGDFNTSSFSNHFGTLLKDGLKDSRMGFGLLPTWPASFEIFQTTLDHCLVSENLVVLDRSTGKSIGSDHLPINIVIRAN